DCNSVLGFEEGCPFPPDAAEMQDGATADRSLSETGSTTDGAKDGSVDERESPSSDAPDVDNAEAGPDACSPSLLTDPKNCGACGHDCTALPNLRTTFGVGCSAGTCVIAPTSCAQGYAHCTTTADDGCETDVTKPVHCGGC